jgi:MFS family permease
MDLEKRIKQTFRSLQHKNFRLFFIGQGISLIGTWMQQIAMIWLVYRLTNSPFLLGLVGFTAQIPTFLIGSFAGVLADRTNRHRVLIITQSLAMLQALLLAILTLTGNISVWYIFPLSALLGIINAFDVPTRQSFLSEMVDEKEDLANAIALNSSMFNSARLIGPAIAGILIAIIGEGFCFLLNALSFIAVIFSLMLMKITPRIKTIQDQGVFQGIIEGLRYAWGFKPIRNILMLLALMSVIGMPYTVLMPVFAKDILHGGSHTLGFLASSAGLGALLGALFLASRKNVIGLGRWISYASGIFGVGLLMLSFSKSLLLSLIILFLIGFGMMVQMASSNTIIQTIVDDDKRGRVMSFYTMAFLGMAPIGSLLAGSLASKIGTPTTILISGIACILGALLFSKQLPAIRKLIRPIYVKLGIIPEVSVGIESATQLNVPPEN